MSSEVKYARSIVTDMFCDGTVVTDATWRGASMELVIEDKEVTILGCQSQNEGQGEMQGLIDRVMSDHSGKKFFSSIPLSSAMKHILDKRGIEYSEDL